MKELHETQEQPKRVFLVGIRDKRAQEETLQELAGLADTLGLDVAAQETVYSRERHPKFGMGTGKAAELAKKAADLKAECLIFDGELSPGQQRNWETLTGISAMDRQELIIHIFASRAKTKEAELQVGLAELTYALPRLRHKYLNLSRQRGGRYGAKGSGETKLETDRRLVEKRILSLEAELAEVRKNREVQRKKRERQGIPVCALVGYTNAGKSSLFNALADADSFVEDKRFATLDTATRQLELEKGGHLLLIDTVGFIRRLPHALVDAFRSTLEEAAQADLLIHVLDASDSEADRCFETTLSVLQELNAEHIPMITVLNKTDRLAAPEELSAIKNRYSGSIPISAKTGQGLEELVRRIEEALTGELTRFRFPADRQDLPSFLYRSGKVVSERYEDAFIEVEARTPIEIRERLREYVIKEE
ncbi:MAG: GTPase HflX [Spirochaetaceae bacterium]|jgi:GTP-binding protein HflX|nr:GTPase HflX [Spirochaetaceae bacterium]